ncbi:MAG: His/Gly/Thr/Pro-type tRNA ligase C-terminal domain-containing protein, partial [Atribacterota bacterium]|nr:His/Gly/Thr/Pro-type tRNA ligase C-terminal domain-containing protein [Atribacterota bacterium]
HGFEVVIDDREASAGYKFNEADLIGFPFQIIVGEKVEKDGVLEIKIRRSGERMEVRQGEIIQRLRDLRKNHGETRES